VTTQKLLTPKEVSLITGFALDTLRDRRCKKQRPNFIKLGSKVMYRQEDVEDFLESCIVNKKLSDEDWVVSQIINDLVAKRKARGFSEADVALKCALSVPTIKAIEGKKVSPTLSALLSLSKALNVWIDELIQKYDK